jgi:RND family efflux transporter MFP subunit
MTSLRRIAMQNKRRLSIAAGVAVIALLLGYLRFSTSTRVAVAAEGNASAPAAEVPVLTVEKKQFSDSIQNLIGTIKGETIELTFNGQEERLTAVHAEVGQFVRSGQVLFELDHIKAEARKNQAESIYERTRELQDVGGATARETAEAQAAFAMAKKDYEDTFIYAPKTGHVSQVNKKVGETVGRSDVIAVVVSSEDRLFLETGVIEGQLDRVASGQEAIVQIDALGPDKLTGRVMGVSREVTTTGRTGTVLVSLPGRVQGKLRPGLSARCDIVTVSRQTLVIPRQAYDKDKKGVYQVGPAGKVVFQPVEIGYVTRDEYEVIDGLKSGDKIVADLVAHPVEGGAKIAAVDLPGNGG